MKKVNENAAQLLETIKAKNPLIHNITNYVVMNYSANALLACGASPIMAHAKEEVEEVVSIASALVLNIGTLTEEWVEAMVLAGKKATQLGIPAILDPVGAGATRFRTDAAKKIISNTNIDVIRGNPSEILSLRKQGAKTKGVDTIHSVNDVIPPATKLAAELNTTIAITGAVDFVTDGQREVRVANGHEMMGFVTGTGCTATAIIGAFLAVGEDPVISTAAGLAFWGLAGEIAAQKVDAPGGYMIALIDSLYRITPSDLMNQGKFS